MINLKKFLVKTLSLIFVVAFAFALSACGETDSSGGGNGSDEPTNNNYTNATEYIQMLLDSNVNKNYIIEVNNTTASKTTKVIVSYENGVQRIFATSNNEDVGYVEYEKTEDKYIIRNYNISDQTYTTEEYETIENFYETGVYNLSMGFAFNSSATLITNDYIIYMYSTVDDEEPLMQKLLIKGMGSLSAYTTASINNMNKGISGERGSYTLTYTYEVTISTSLYGYTSTTHCAYTDIIKTENNMITEYSQTAVYDTPSMNGKDPTYTITYGNEAKVPENLSSYVETVESND